MNQHALVVGGSMAGLLAARILADHFARVTVIERDALPDSPDWRSGVPQARHAHALLARGQAIMEGLFPGLTEELTAYGSPRMELGYDGRYCTPGGWIKRFHSGQFTNLVNRTSFEWHIRKRLCALPNINILEEHAVDSLLTDPQGQTVTGVLAKQRKTQTAREIQADLVVDASGRNSQAPEWLQAIGYPAPNETNVNGYIGYATRWFQKPANAPDWKLLFINARPAEKIYRGGAIFEIEGGRWMVTLGGMSHDYPPTDEMGWMDYAKSLPVPDLYEALQGATPITPIYSYRIKGSRQRHYEKLAHRPENFIVMGDAVCAFNPLYGQGMTVAAIEAQALGQMVAGGALGPGFAGKFQAKIATLIKDAWLMATGEDFRYPATDGDKPNFLARITQRYVDMVMRAMPHDEKLTLAFLEVSNLQAPPTILMQPQYLMRTLRYGRG